MKKKVTITALMFMLCITVSTYVCAATGSQLLERLNAIKTEVQSIKANYENVVLTYADVFDSLSEPNRQNAKKLANNMVAEDISVTINAIKAELSMSTIPGSDEVLTAITDLENDCKNVINNNSQVVVDLKNSYVNLSSSELEQVISLSKDIVSSLGMDIDTSVSFEETKNILNDVYTKVKEINLKLKDIISNPEYQEAYEEALTIDVLKELLNAIDSTSYSKVVSVLSNAALSTSHGAALKSELDDVKADINALESVLNLLDTLPEQELILFSNSQFNEVSQIIDKIEKEYINFAKDILLNYANGYVAVTMKLAYTDSVDNVIEYANKVLDYVQDYDKLVKNYVVKIPDSLKTKVSLLVVLGYIDPNEYNVKFVKDNFDTELKQLMNLVSSELVKYVDYIDIKQQKEITNLPENMKNTELQAYIRNINMPRFKTLNNLKALIKRLKTVLANNSSLVTLLDEAAPVAYGVFNKNMLVAIEKIMTLENSKEDKLFEFDSVRFGIVSASFLDATEVLNILGIDEGFVTYTGLKNNKFITGSVMNITLSDTVFGQYTIAVLGDVYNDGVVDARDYMAIKNQIMGKDTLSAISKVAANTYRDNVIDARDYMAIKNQIMEKDTISL